MFKFCLSYSSFPGEKISKIVNISANRDGENSQIMSKKYIKIKLRDYLQ